ncbi:5024_t:CDS:2 [Paraglomus brasilianum]|uniref:5024_t:CDS:1 n=1 Tax=Paraglomus brasilianum TaxID=144538 RepID=A0A9N9BRY4_9GLOM|nr:5024_t:CDS:2 [Paraglomus brasilianum]
MNRYICSFFILGLLILITSGVYADCSPSPNCGCPSTLSCKCPSTDTGGLFCGSELTCTGSIEATLGLSDIWQCSPGGGLNCRFGPCNIGCCSVENQDSFCCLKAGCADCTGTAVLAQGGI